MGFDGFLGRVIDRRSALGALGLVALAGCTSSSKSRDSGSSSSTTSRSGPTTTTDCVLTPEETEGPFGLDLSDETEFVRRDITEGRPGVPLAVTFVVLDVAKSCAPIADARVDVWHTDKDGVYSGFDQPDDDTVGETFMRGIQRTDATGNATFDTVYPGWYEGRATHIHYQVFLGDGLVATSQLAFPDDVTAEVYRSDLYRSRGQNDSVPTTADDMIFSDGTAGELLALTGSMADGYRGTISVGIRTP
jgi:protocatechuate 3,4-dioxygenase beta subunit